MMTTWFPPDTSFADSFGTIPSPAVPVCELRCGDSAWSRLPAIVPMSLLDARAHTLDVVASFRAPTPDRDRGPFAPPQLDAVVIGAVLLAQPRDSHDAVDRR